MENPDGAVGRHLRQRRKALELSLQRIADQAGISVGHLSQIERGLSSPSVRDLIRIAEILQASPGDFLDQSGMASPDPIMVRRTRRPPVMLKNGITKRLLTPQDEAPLKMFMVTLAPDSTTGDDLYTHEGVEAGLVLEGRITLVVEDRDMLLEAGDSFRFASSRPHRFMNAHDGESRVLWVNCAMPAGGPA
ncbi:MULTISPECIES: cupin domain-containing protein [Gluconacetobacter]|uniref:Cupin domain-containing protein n=2 Tax=Gluconacetobacter TaxID=89583 RepID=A0A7W4JGS7_9PROT|nr:MULTISPECIES: cupin domain-containing protein [Gluconacetobacter]MBB2174078.1 cupin domain-containing protein [Gluconacetobacter asukensis]MBB2180814.1 cupin domain-containing protein [Gluconacetobacter tumulicola]